MWPSGTFHHNSKQTRQQAAMAARLTAHLHFKLVCCGQNRSPRARKRRLPSIFDRRKASALGLTATTVTYDSPRRQGQPIKMRPRSTCPFPIAIGARLVPRYDFAPAFFFFLFCICLLCLLLFLTCFERKQKGW